MCFRPIFRVFKALQCGEKKMLDKILVIAEYFYELMCLEEELIHSHSAAMGHSGNNFSPRKEGIN